MNKAIGAALAGTKYLSVEIAQMLALRDYAGTQRNTLSDRETEILRLLASGCAVTAIAKSLGLTAKTISNYPTAIKRKLAAACGDLRSAAAAGLMAGPLRLAQPPAMSENTPERTFSTETTLWEIAGS